MALTRKDVAEFVLGYFRQRYPRVAEGDDLREDLLLGDADIVQIGQDLNNWHGVILKPSEVRNCKTVKDIIELIWGKLKPKRKVATTAAKKSRSTNTKPRKSAATRSD